MDRPGCSLYWVLHWNGEYCSRNGNHTAEHFKKGSVVGDSSFLSWPGLYYLHGVAVRLNFKQAISSFNNSVKSLHKSASSIFEYLCWISAFHTYLWTLQRGAVMKLGDYHDTYSILIPSLFKKTSDLATDLHFIFKAVPSLLLPIDHYLRQYQVCRSSETDMTCVVSLANTSYIRLLDSRMLTACHRSNTRIMFASQLYSYVLIREEGCVLVTM